MLRQKYDKKKKKMPAETPTTEKEKAPSEMKGAEVKEVEQTERTNLKTFRDCSNQTLLTTRGGWASCVYLDEADWGVFRG